MNYHLLKVNALVTKSNQNNFKKNLFVSLSIIMFRKKEGVRNAIRNDRVRTYGPEYGDSTG